MAGLDFLSPPQALLRQRHRFSAARLVDVALLLQRVQHKAASSSAQLILSLRVICSSFQVLAHQFDHRSAILLQLAWANAFQLG